MVTQIPQEHREPGLLIAFEGAEGSGKTTQLRLLKQFLCQRYPGREVVTTREPGGCSISEQVRAVLHDSRSTNLAPIAEVYGYAFARAQSLREVVFPPLTQGAIVLQDRTFLSSLAYQGFGQELGWELVWEVNKNAVGRIIPDLVIYPKLEPEIGLARKRTQGETNVWEQRDVEIHRRCCQGYDFLASESPFASRFLVVDGNLSIPEIELIIRQRVEGLVAEGNQKRVKDAEREFSE
jgi:dTMP kinase